MNSAEAIDTRVCTSALECALPIYIRMLPRDMAALFDWVETGKVPHRLLQSHSEAWLMTAYSELREAGLMADKWLHASIDELHGQKLDDLSDLSLAAYASLLQDRSHESNDRGRDRIRLCDAYQRLLDNGQGSILLDYGWLYGDILEYPMEMDYDMFWRIHDHALVHEIHYGTEARLLDVLLRRVTDEIEEGDLNRGVEWISRIIENYPGKFAVYERAATAFFQAKRDALGQMVLHVAGTLTLDPEEAHEYDDVCFLYRRKEHVEPRGTGEELRLARALSRSAKNGVGLSPAELTRALFPAIDMVPVKQIAVL
jgi:hypothetical protein